MVARESLLVTVVSVILAIAGPASASPESDKLFREGRELLKAGKIADACDSFAHSEQLDAKVGTLLNLADCREKQGKTATAWAVFLEAKALAAATHDGREAEADKRATEIHAKLAYLTITVAADQEVAGLVVKRNGVAVDRAQWNLAVPLDPGDYVIEATAPNHEPWSAAKQVLDVKASLAVVVPALVASPVTIVTRTGPAPVEVTAGGAPIARPVKLPSPPVRPLSVGLMIAETSDSDTVFGGRITGGIPVSQGALRAIGSVLYEQFDDDASNPGSNTKLFALGLSVDYLWMPVPMLAFGGGLGIGQDRQVKNLDRPTETAGWWTLRASPVVVRLAQGRVEAGLHVQYVRVSGRAVVIGLVAIDLFPL